MSLANVIALPTAAARQVKQPTTREARQARRTFRADHPWPGTFLWPAEREAERQRSERLNLFANLSHSPELAIILGLLRTMPAERIEAVRKTLDLFPDGGESEALLQARAVVDMAAESRRTMERVAKLYEDLP